MSVFLSKFTSKKPPNPEIILLIPSNILQIDLARDESVSRNYDVVRRSGKLYDRRKHSSQWDEVMKCDVVWLFDWVDLPRPIQDYIVARAACFTVSRIVGDANLYKMCQEKEAYMRAMALEYECNQGEFTFFGHPKDGNFYTSYEPHHALHR